MGLPVLGQVVLSSLCRLMGGRTPRLGAVMGSFRGWGVWDGGGLCRYEDCAGAAASCWAWLCLVAWGVDALWAFACVGCFRILRA